MEQESTSSSIHKFPHHVRSELCTTRPPYRQGRKLTAVKVENPWWIKVYTVNEESQHLLIRGVPALNLRKELKHLCMRYGEIKFVNVVTDYSNDEESFTEVHHVLFARIQSARFAKHMIDDKSFYGGVLHVCYAPELESITETRQKLQQRRYDVLRRIKSDKNINQMFLSKANNSGSNSASEYSTHSNIQSTTKSGTHQVGRMNQQLVSRKRGQSVTSQDSFIPISSHIKRKRYLPVKNSSISSSSDILPSPVVNNSSVGIAFPEKFIPSSLRRKKIEFKS